jgi:hypothetical protein
VDPSTDANTSGRPIRLIVVLGARASPAETSLVTEADAKRAYGGFQVSVTVSAR